MSASQAESKDRRSGARRHAEVDTAIKPGLAGVLVEAGLVVRQRAAAAAGLPACGLRVAGGSGRRLDEALAEGEALRGETSPALALLVDAMDERQAARAAALTPFVYALNLPVQALAALVLAARETWGRSRRRTGAPEACRSACIRLGESVEIDGVPVDLGVAERNFLFGLAERRGAWISKEDDVEAGHGRSVAARECRRRLGRRLGSELASLLVPEVRGEPYRLRQPDEMQSRAARGLPFVTLRIVGRAGARLSFRSSVDEMA